MTASGGQQLDEADEVAAPRSRHEGVDDLPVGERILGCGLGSLGAGTAGELAGRDRGGVEDRGDGVELEAETVVQDERDPLLGVHPVEHDLQRDADRVGERDHLGGVIGGIRVGLGDLEVLLRHRRALPESVEAESRRHGRQPGGQAVDLGARALQPQPRLLDDVLGLGVVTEHLGGDAGETRPLGLEAGRQEFFGLIAHSWSHFHSGIRHHHDERGTARVTDGRLNP